ncbi:MAG: hypothetical protein JKX68_04805 [Flavobacteriales bacterium]|nr:hypothetical protein [Flavobacteriales bacterium]
MKYLLLTSIVLFLSVNSFAKKHKIKKAKNPKLSYQEYIIQYGNNDTSVAIINLFFDKRNETAVGKMSFLPITAGITMFVPPIGLGLSAITSPLFISGLITRTRYSHKNLLIALKSYHNTNMLSANFQNKIFKQIKAQKKEIYIAESEEQLMALREIRNE